MPAGRVKVIHTVGAVCQFTLDVSKDSPYTGLLAPGPQHGFIRMGGAANWTVDSKGYPPGHDSASPPPWPPEHLAAVQESVSSLLGRASPPGALLASAYPPTRTVLTMEH